METTDNLTASEVTNLWNIFLGNSMAIGVTTYFIKTAKDPEVVTVLEDALSLATYEAEGARNLFEQFGHPQPQGFSRDDFNFTAPALYNDNLILSVKFVLGQDAVSIYGIAMSESTHSNIRQYFYTCMTRTADFLQQVMHLMETKGLFHPKINLPVPDNIEKVKKQSFAGNWLNGNRPLNTQEVMQIVMNFRNIEVIKEFFRSFIQITSSKKLQEHYKRGEKMTAKHLEILQSLLDENDLPHMSTMENEITESTIKPFTDRMMLYKISVFVSATVSRYGTATSMIMRKDVGVDFSKLMSEMALFGEDTLNLMIEFEYMDQLPLGKYTRN